MSKCGERQVTRLDNYMPINVIDLVGPDNKDHDEIPRYLKTIILLDFYKT